MARSVLNSFVSGTRQMLAVQLFVSVGSVALAGYTVAVTNNAIRERDRLTERVIQLEEALGQAGIAPPQAVAIPDAPPADLYPPPIEPAPTSETQDAPAGQTGPETTTTIEETPAPADTNPPRDASTPTDADKPPETPGQRVPGQNADATQTPQTQTENPPAFDPGQILRELLTPPPPLRSVVLHIRARTDYDEAQTIARQLAANNLNVSIDIMPPNDQRQSGYAYFHGRQSRPAADIVQRVQDAARGAEIAAWSVQLRGTALPASGEYTADRLDVVLPPLPADGPRVNPQILRQRTQIQPNVVQQPQTDPNAPR